MKENNLKDLFYPYTEEKTGRGGGAMRGNRGIYRKRERNG